MKVRIVELPVKDPIVGETYPVINSTGIFCDLGTPCHLFFFSDEPLISEGDMILRKSDNQIGAADFSTEHMTSFRTRLGVMGFSKEDAMKCVACTNQDLLIKDKKLPSIPLDFIRRYCAKGGMEETEIKFLSPDTIEVLD